MGVDNTGDLDLQHSAMSFLSSQFSGMYPDHAQKTMSVSKAATGPPHDASEQFVVTEWDPLMPMHQNGDFGGALSLPAFDSGLMGSQAIHCSSVGMADQIPTIPCFTSGGLSQPIATFGADIQVDLSRDYNHEVAGDANGKKRKTMSGCGAFDSNSSLNRSQNADYEQPRSVLSPQPLKGSDMKKDEKRHRSEQNSCSNSRKSTSKQAKEHTQNGDDGKEDYIHVRAKRGQATNSHSLAERVRREKISERMRFLQNLVPGCNKITGKAVMLDEIINYVQSLQRQVEFLSMKLATVNPEQNFDIVHLLSKDMLHSRGGFSAALGFAQGMNSICHSNGFVPQPAIQPEMLFHRVSNPQEIMGNCLSQISPIAQTSTWDDELHNAIQMGFIPHMPAGISDTEPPGNQD